MLLQSILETSARRFPEKEAAVSRGRRFTYPQIERKADEVADNLRSRGAAVGDRVVIHTGDPLDTVIALFGVLKAGCAFVVTHPSTKARKLEWILRDCEAAAAIGDEKSTALLNTVAAHCPALNFVTRIDTEAKSNTYPTQPVERADTELAGLIYTSGSTGNPKGVMLSHRNITAAMESIASYLALTEQDVTLSVLPLSFGYGLGQVFLMFMVGGTIVFEDSFIYGHRLLSTIGAEKVTGLPLVPTLAAMLLKLDLRAYQFPSLRYLTNAGAALPVSTLRKLQAAFPAAQLFSMYGLTECLRVSYLDPEELYRLPDSIGRGMANQELYLVDEAGRRLPPGSTGELVVRGPHVMLGYWRRPEDTLRALRPGEHPGEVVLHTGDIFRMDQEGFLYFLSRTDDIIKTRGEKVSPREVENAIAALDGVEEVAVVGVPDPVLGQSVKAIVTLRAGASISEREIRGWCTAHLEEFMVPKVVEVVNTLPIAENGKIARRELAALLARG